MVWLPEESQPRKFDRIKAAHAVVAGRHVMKVHPHGDRPQGRRSLCREGLVGGLARLGSCAPRGWLSSTQIKGSTGRTRADENRKPGKRPPECDQRDLRRTLLGSGSSAGYAVARRRLLSRCSFPTGSTTARCLAVLGGGAGVWRRREPGCRRLRTGRAGRRTAADRRALPPAAASSSFGTGGTRVDGGR